jgi:hypothetical protein
MLDDFLPVVFFTLVGGAWVTTTLRLPVLLIEGLLPESLAVVAAKLAPGGLLEIGTTRIGS